MRYLLKSDFYRLSKSKLSLVTLIMAAVLPLLGALLFLGLGAFLKSVDPDAQEAINLVGGQALIFSCFSFSNNFGIILPIFAAIFIIMDVNSGTIRNKIILGYRRHQIFASHYITVLTYCLVMIGLYAGMTVLWSNVILGPIELTESLKLSYLYYFILGFLSFALVASIASFYSLSTLNSAGSIILTLVTCLLLSLVSQILSMFDFSSYEFVNYILYALPCFVTSLASNKEITTVMFVEALGGIVLFSAIFYTAGALIFSRRDLK